KGAQPASSPAQATIGAEFVITMLPNGDLVRSVLFGEQGVCETALYETMEEIGMALSGKLRESNKFTDAEKLERRQQALLRLIK
ncbi:NAD(P)-binding domain-containing protein, partial [Salmonella enterica subsp. enterica serovar Anatum]|nr:NAD(P)-binding domain-containing protein [Salmonella enterica subsp. enterica serovar Anatum]